MPGSKRKHTSTAKQLNQAAFLSLVDNLGTDLEFCSVINSSIDGRHIFLSKIIQAQALLIGFTIPPSADPLQLIQSRLGCCDSRLLSTSALHLRELFHIHALNLRSQRRYRQHVSARLGLSLSALPNLPVHRLKRWPDGSEYPPRNHFVLERADEPIPPPPKVKDPTCNSCNNFHVLDPSQLSFTLSSDQSAIFIDHDTEEIVSVVIRDLARDYFSQVGPWAVDQSSFSSLSTEQSRKVRKSWSYWGLSVWWFFWLGKESQGKIQECSGQARSRSGNLIIIRNILRLTSISSTMAYRSIRECHITYTSTPLGSKQLRAIHSSATS